MMHLKAKCDLWIAIIAFKDGNEAFVHAGKLPPASWILIGDLDQFIQLHSGDTLTFKAIADGSDPYAQLATRYPEWFEVVP